nr:MAG TPA: hypothetical protein [Caudoviricetes sp.]
MQQLACIYSDSIRVMIFCCLLAGWYTATSHACNYNHLIASATPLLHHASTYSATTI